MGQRAMIGLVIFVLWGCSGGDDGGAGSDVTIEDGPLSGQVAGEAWSMLTAETDPFLSADDPNFWVDAYAEAVTPCSGTFPDGHHIILSVPKSPGDYPLSLSLNATFVIEGPSQTLDNLVATEGHIVVEEVTDTLVRGGAYVKYDDANWVNGQFEISVCP